MRLVQREQAHPAAVQQIQAARRHQPFRRDIEQIQFAAPDRAFDRHRLAPVQRRIEIGRAHAQLAQRIDLIAHQRDQRRHHHRHPWSHQRRDLKAQRFAAAGRHQHHGVAAGDHMIDDVGLLAAKGGIAEHRPQDVQRLVPAADGDSLAQILGVGQQSER
jgi:hypothetical protein